MATSSTLEDVLDQLLDECRGDGTLESGLGLKLLAANVAASTTLTSTHPELNRLGASTPSQRLSGWYVWAADNNEERMITTLTVSSGTATITVSGANFTSDASATVYILRVSIDTIRAILNDALAEITVLIPYPLNHGPDDADLQDNDTVDASWTETNATDTAQTTASEVFPGAARSLVVTDSGSGGGYAASTTVRIGTGKQFTMHAIAKSDTGTSALRAVDTAGTTLDTVSFTEEEWLYIKKTVTATSTEGVALRLLESDASAAGDWQHAWIVKHDSRMFRLPSWADARFRIRGVARFYFNSGGPETDTWIAESLEPRRLVEGDDYTYYDFEAAVHPHSIVFGPHLNMSDPYFVYIECPWTAPYGVAAVFTTIATTTLCPLRLLIPYAVMLVGQRCGTVFAAKGKDMGRTYKERRQGRLNDMPRREVKVRHILG